MLCVCVELKVGLLHQAAPPKTFNHRGDPARQKKMPLNRSYPIILDPAKMNS